MTSTIITAAVLVAIIVDVTAAIPHDFAMLPISASYNDVIVASPNVTSTIARNMTTPLADVMTSNVVSDYDVTESTTTNATTNPIWTSGRFVTIWYSVTSALAGFGNLVILLTFASYRKLLDKNFNVLILNLAVADFAVGAFDMPGLVSIRQKIQKLLSTKFF